MSDLMNEEKIHFILDENFSKNAKLKVVGVGGAGGNALNRMKEMEISDVEFIGINTDALALENSLADIKIPIGKETTKNLGAGARPEIGRQSALEEREKIKEALDGADMIFIAAGMGGGTGTGAAPVIAELARELGILTVAVVSLPFDFEGPVRMRNAKNGLITLKDKVDSIITIENTNIFNIIDNNTTTKQAYLAADEILGNAVRSVCNIIREPGDINIDFRDIKTIVENGGDAIMGTGVGEGEDRALLAAEKAVKCPLLGDLEVKGAKGVLVNICHSENFTMNELRMAMNYIYEAIGYEQEPEIIFGDCIKKELGEKVTITIIATGFHGAKEYSAPVVVEERVSLEEVREPQKTREQSIGRDTTSFTGLMRESQKIKAVEATPVVSREEVVFSEKVVERESAPVLTNSPTGFQNFNLDVRATETPEEVLRSSEFITAKNPTFASSAMDFESPTSFAPIPEDKNEMVAVEASDWPSNFDFDALPENRSEFLNEHVF